MVLNLPFIAFHVASRRHYFVARHFHKHHARCPLRRRFGSRTVTVTATGTLLHPASRATAARRAEASAGGAWTQHFVGGGAEPPWSVDATFRQTLVVPETAEPLRSMHRSLHSSVKKKQHHTVVAKLSNSLTNWLSTLKAINWKNSHSRSGHRGILCRVTFCDFSGFSLYSQPKLLQLKAK